MVDGEDGGYYPCTGLDEGGGVRRHAISTHLGVVYCSARYMHRHICGQQRSLAGAWPRVIVVRTLNVRYPCIRRYVILPVCIAMGDVSSTAIWYTSTECVVICT